MQQLGAFSEVGKLRKVMVCRPGLAHQRLTPDNCHALLFDDVIWVKQAKNEHHGFVSVMQDRGVEVLEMHDLLAEILDLPHARSWVLDRKIIPNQVGTGMLQELRAWLDEMPSRQLAEHLIGGISRAELPFDPLGTFGQYLEPTEFVIPPLPNTSSPGTRPAGSMGESRSTRSIGRPAARKPC